MSAVIEVRQLHKRYGDTVAVDDISFSVQEGEIFGILGPNGAGKTTTVECIEGLGNPDRGTVSVLGLDPGHERAELTQRLGVQLQDSQLPGKLRVEEALDLYSSFYRDPAGWRPLIDMLGLASKAKTRFGKLSGGRKQRLSIALSLVGSPQIVILDELTTGPDPAARHETWELIEGVRDRVATIVLVTHFMEQAERLCDRVALIDSGRAVAIDTPANHPRLGAARAQPHRAQAAVPRAGQDGSPARSPSPPCWPPRRCWARACWSPRSRRPDGWPGRSGPSCSTR
jgi:ABC-2 type transport system ATP-binding protein